MAKRKERAARARMAVAADAGGGLRTAGSAAVGHPAIGGAAVGHPAVGPAVPGHRAAVAAPLAVETTTVQVAGMTCRSCEARIERHVRAVPNVERVSASAARGRVEIAHSGPLSARRVEAAINAAGYELGRTPWLTRDPEAWITAAAAIVALVAFALVAGQLGLTDLTSRIGNLASGGILVALLLGLAAGVSTCMALVGGLILALSASFEARLRDDDELRSRASAIQPTLAFVSGRILGYALFGAVLGGLGASVALPTQLVGALMIVVAIVMTILGARLTGISPRMAAWSPTLPPALSRRLGLETSAGGAYSDSRAIVLGALSFFLPCGFTQAVQIYALSTGSPLTAGAIMAAFAFGTAPGLLALGGLPSFVPTSAKPTLLRLVGVLVIGFAAINGTAGLRLTDIALPSLVPGPVAAAAPLPSLAAGATSQDLHTYQNANGYEPGNVSIRSGIPTRWTITSRSQQSCAIFVRIPSLQAAFTLRDGDNEVDLPALRAGTYRYTCGMGMYAAQITVVDAPAGS